jgi:hypothetical protein
MSDAPEFQNRTPAPTSSLALTSVIMGVVGWTLLPIVGAIIAVITGHMAKKEIRQSDGLLGGDGLAKAGLVLGYSNLGVGLCGCLLLVLFPPLLIGLAASAEQIFNTIP